MDKLSYALGMSMASNLMNSGLRNIDVPSFTDAFNSIVNNTTPSMSPQEANQVIQAFFSQRQDEMLTRNLEAGKAFLAENSKKENVVTLSSGLQYEVLTAGDG
ncbi:MAG: FKBP-type peptidyl-prolyl cis-trans isomerase N-terminal domain-containing protein, partial [Proteiniphilum sp.]